MWRDTETGMWRDTDAHVYPANVYLAHSHTRSRPLLRAEQTRTHAAIKHKHARTHVHKVSRPALPPSPSLPRLRAHSLTDQPGCRSSAIKKYSKTKTPGCGRSPIADSRYTVIERSRAHTQNAIENTTEIELQQRPGVNGHRHGPHRSHSVVQSSLIIRRNVLVSDTYMNYS